jgi:hypothetical protein
MPAKSDGVHRGGICDIRIYKPTFYQRDTNLTLKIKSQYLTGSEFDKR